MSDQRTLEQINKLFLIGKWLRLGFRFKNKLYWFYVLAFKKQKLKAYIKFGRQVAPKPYVGNYNSFIEQSDPMFIYGYSIHKLFDVLFKENYISVH